jgi:hypothetical protein
MDDVEAAVQVWPVVKELSFEDREATLDEIMQIEQALEAIELAEAGEEDVLLVDLRHVDMV